MKEWICREMSTSTSGNENGVLMMETELIRCRYCKFAIDEYGDGDCYCRTKHEMLRYIGDWNHYCGWAERKEK